MELINKVTRIRHLFVGAFSFFFLLLIISCSEEPLKVGIHLLPEDELLQVYDTVLPVELYTISAKALKVYSLSSSPLGSVYDPVMGALKTDYLADIFYSAYVSFLDTIVEENIDVYNLELLLYYDVIYGDSLAIDFNVYELIEPIPEGKNSDFIVTPEMINPTPLNLGAPERLNDSTRAFKVMLSLDYAKKFIDPQLIEDSVYTANPLLFKEYFKGFYFATDFRSTEGGGIMRVNNSTSKMILRTLEWNSNSMQFDTINNEFSIGNPAIMLDSSDVVNLSMFQSIPGDDVAAILDDTLNSQSIVYIQSLAGPNVLIDFPTLENFGKKFGDNIVINKAELILPVNQELYDDITFVPPRNLGLYDHVSKSFLADDGLLSYYFGGVLDTVNYQYKFNVGNHIHEYLHSDSDTLFSKKYILFPSKATTPVYYLETLPRRIVLNGRNSAEKPSLKIMYSLMPE